MSRFFMSEFVYAAVRCGLAMVFLYSGVMKLADLGAFASVIEAYGIVPWEFKSLSALVISLAEVFAGAGLLLDVRGSLTAVAVMLVVFMAVLGLGIHMGYDIDCGCFGEDDPVGKAMHGLGRALIRDLVFTAGVLYCYVWRYLHSHEPAGLATYFYHLVNGKKRRSL
ncbi:MAG: MauE/DoxX family redox-associated membrane protein [Pseudomonadota bacterium]